MSEPTWSISGTLAKSTGNPPWVFDQSQASLGLTVEEAHTWRDSIVSLLAIEVPGRSDVDPPLDSFVRQNSLVSVYPPRNMDQLRHQVRYAINESDGQTMLDLILSAQTNLLHSDPMITVRSQWQRAAMFVSYGGDVLQLRESKQFADGDARPIFFLVRPRELAELSLVAMQQPGDFYRATVTLSQDDRHDTTELAYQVFPDALEKGVIRRARFQHCFVARDRDQQEAERLADKLANSPPVLNS